MRNDLIVDVAQYAIVLVGLLGLLVWIRLPARRRLPCAVDAIVGLVAALILVKVASAVWTDPRPFVVNPGGPPLFAHPADNGFPSDHTTVSAAVSVVVLRYSRRIGVIMLLLAVAIGWARVAAHVHHWPDIIGGLVLGVVAAGLTLAASAAWQRRRRTT